MRGLQGESSARGPFVNDWGVCAAVFLSGVNVKWQKVPVPKPNPKKEAPSDVAGGSKVDFVE